MMSDVKRQMWGVRRERAIQCMIPNCYFIFIIITETPRRSMILFGFEL